MPDGLRLPGIEARLGADRDAASPSVRHGLRVRTAGLHAAAERAFALEEIDNLKRYGRLLEVHLEIYRRLERELTDRGIWRGLPLDLSADVDRLCADLGAIGEVPPPPRAAPGLGLDTDAERLGCRYVLEGSRLGALAISKALAAALGVHGGWGATFFDRPKPETRERWSRFCALLERCCSGDEELDLAVRGSEKTFRLFLEGFREAGRRERVGDEQTASL